ncbi:hypothetical protein PBAL39_19025 [Pedobacter sp. BAL39]|nr:hypothetical protein PBAL39_19025 [Pedobacter sp. BAL39]
MACLPVVSAAVESTEDESFMLPSAVFSDPQAEMNKTEHRVRLNSIFFIIVILVK